jgi:ABC-type lipoprotein export system ATPase subunit
VPAPDPTVVDAAAAVAARGVSVEYPTVEGAALALDLVDLDVERARLTVVAGPSGSGKSSLLRVVAGLQRPTAGTVHLDGLDLWRLRPWHRRRLRRRSMGIVLQAPADNLVEYLTAQEQVELAARLRGADAARAADLLTAVGLGDHGSLRPAELSGGEQQRVAFAAAAVGQPRVLLADEPTAQLDASAGHALVGALRALVDRGTTVLVASHDAEVIGAADHTVTLLDGRRVEP